MIEKSIGVITKDVPLIKFISSSLKKLDGEFTIKVAQSPEEAKEFAESSDSIHSLIVIDALCIDCLDNFKDSPRNDIPILIMIDDDAEYLNAFDFDKLSHLKIYDFIRRPFLANIFYNKVKLLINLAESNKILNSDKTIALSHLWSLLNYTNMYVMVLDDHTNIKIANYPLIKFMGFEDEKDAVGVNWLQFVSDVDKEAVKHTINKLTSGQEVYSELTHEICNDKETVQVRWFSSYINNKTHWMFCIGVPISHSISNQENVDTIRAYYRDIIMKDREMIKNIKEVTAKYSKEIFGKECSC